MTEKSASAYTLTGQNGDFDPSPANKTFVTKRKYDLEVLFADVDFSTEPPYTGTVVKSLSVDYEVARRLKDQLADIIAKREEELLQQASAAG